MGAVRSTIHAAGSTIFGPGEWRHTVARPIGARTLQRGVVRIDGSLIHLPQAVHPYVAGLLRLDEYETAERYAIAKFLPRDLPVIEFGGGVGAIACLTNRLLHDRSQHWVVEANPTLVPVLARNRDVNGAQFQICHGALAYVSGGTINMDIDSAVLETHVDDERATTSVPAVTLADLVERSGFARFCLICDIEGMESELLARESSLLQDRVALIIVEVHPDRLGNAAVEGMARHFAQLGFRNRWTSGDVWVLMK
jgi:FkbM family methyltransferase